MPNAWFCFVLRPPLHHTHPLLGPLYFLTRRQEAIFTVPPLRTSSCSSSVTLNHTRLVCFLPPHAFQGRRRRHHRCRVSPFETARMEAVGPSVPGGTGSGSCGDGGGGGGRDAAAAGGLGGSSLLLLPTLLPTLLPGLLPPRWLLQIKNVP